MPFGTSNPIVPSVQFLNILNKVEH